MTHSGYTNYFENLANRHHQIQNGVGGRKSFFRMNEEGEMVQALVTKVDFPALLLPMYRGRLRNDDNLVADVMTGGFEIRQHVGDPFSFAEIDAARDTCKTIALEILAFMAQEQEEQGYCGELSDVDLSTVGYDFTGPTNQNEYGVRVFLEFEDRAFNLTNLDLTGKFL